MRALWPFAALGGAACVVIALWPVSSALPAGVTLPMRLVAAALTVVGCTVVALPLRWRAAAWVAISAASVVAAAGLLWGHSNALGGCLADYDGHPVVIGREVSPDAEGYVRENPTLSSSDRLLDAGGDPARIWTASSIQTCRTWIGWGGLLSVPCLAMAIGAVMAARRPRLSSLATRPTASTAPRATTDSPVIRYDAFLSYRHLEPDRGLATTLVDALEGRGFRVAIDVRDFAPNEHFLSEMERCIKESRFVLCVITSRYLDSDHTSEEAIISKTLDMAERRKRLVPLIFERVELPVWLHGLVGIDCTQAAQVDPLERVLTLLDQPASRSSSS